MVSTLTLPKKRSGARNKGKDSVDFEPKPRSLKIKNLAYEMMMLVLFCIMKIENIITTLSHKTNDCYKAKK